MGDKKRILFVGEGTGLSTGYARIHRELIPAFHATGKYEIAEMAAYTHRGMEWVQKSPWKVYPNLPENEEEKRVYDSNRINEFGLYKIDRVLLDFQPDIVICCRDPWMDGFLANNRFRGNYKLIMMPTIDSAPQRREWIDGQYKNADVITTYSEYGRRVLESEGVNVRGVTSPGVNLDLYYPMDKRAIREKFHITPSLFIYGTVMRNQRRKLFPDLFDGYRQLRDKYAPRQLVGRIKEKVKMGKPLSSKEKEALRIDHSVLYCHTSFPDPQGWDIPQYLGRAAVQRHVIFTYKCEACKAVYASWFTPCNPKGMSVCNVCQQQAAHMPSTHHGVTDEELAEIFNLFDVYVHPAICEGWGLPIVESKACGVPGLYQNYSAMEDHVQNGGGLPIKIQRMYHEPETWYERSLPDLSSLVDGMFKLATNDKLREKMGKEARECAERLHSSELMANKFIRIVDELDIKDRTTTWDVLPSLSVVVPQKAPQGLSDNDFILWCYVNILGRAPDEKGFTDWMNALAQKQSRDSIEDYFRSIVAQQNDAESVRYSKSLELRNIPPPPVEAEHIEMLPGVQL